MSRVLALLVFLACAYGIWRTLPEERPTAGGDLAACLADASAVIERRQAAGEIGGEEAMVLRQGAVGDCRASADP